MEFTKDQFISFCHAVTKPGTTIDLPSFCEGFGYFEMKPYANESTIRYNVGSVSNTGDEIKLYCTTHIGEFHTGECVVYEDKFMRYAKEIHLHGNFSSELIDIYNQITNE